MNTVTITLNDDSYFKYRTIAKIGDVIKIKKRKRFRLIVTGHHQGNGYANIFTNKAYAPSPKSRLNNKSKFSKHKTPIIKLTTR